MREDDRWLSIYGVAFVALYREIEGTDISAVRKCRQLAEELADQELATRSEHEYPRWS
jgi:hypothetical protein